MPTTKRPYRDIGLARISKDDERRGKGTARQEQDVRRKSAETGGDIHEMFVEDDVPASRFNRKQREKYHQMLDLLRSGTRDRIIVYRLDRLTRIPRVLEDLIDLCEQRPFLVVNLHGTMDLNTAEGRKSARDRVNDGAYESDLISERTKRAFDESADAGLPHGGRAFGYACPGWRPCDGDGCCHLGADCAHRPRHKRCCRIPGCPHDGVTVIDPEADVLRQATVDVFAGESLQAVARRWNALGFLTPNRYRPWDASTVKSVLVNPHHAGLRVHRGDYRIYDETGVVVGKRRGAWEPIISIEEHDALVRLLTNPARGRQPPRRRTPFTGLFTTVEGVKLLRNVDSGNKVYRWQDRPGRTGGTFIQVRADLLEEWVLGLLFGEVEAGRVAERVAQRRRARPEKPAGEDPAVVQRELNQLAADKADPELGLTRAEWLAQRNVLLHRLEVAEATQETVTADAALVDVDADVRARWELPEGDGGYSVDRKRAILSAVFERVVVHKALRRGPGLDTRRVEPIWRE